ncbi:pectate lyase family protein [Streptomyces canus]|uniref:pectate lyase family protein n=1 Tax=Streptomyces canus TaxID=58343 RepID=UPI003416AA13
MILRRIGVDMGLLESLCVPAHAEARDLSRETLPPNDCWAAADGRITGGATVDDGHVYTVTDCAGLAHALDGSSDAPEIIKIAGTIAANTDDTRPQLDCAEYATGGYRTKKYLAAYDRSWAVGRSEPAYWHAPNGLGRAGRPPSPPEGDTDPVRGPVLEGRSPSRSGHVGAARGDGEALSHLAGGAGAPHAGTAPGVPDRTATLPRSAQSTASLQADDHTIELKRPPVSPANSCHPDADEPTYFARNYLRHDGLLDITNGSDLVTVSWSRFADHDKAMLIGNSDSATGDRGRLRVTLHHNQFESVVQRAPRVRFGQVHLYNNRYLARNDDYRYSLGISTESAVHAENNAFHTPGHIEAADLVKSWNGSAPHQTGTLFNGYPVDLLALYNAYDSGSERDLTADVGWTPTLHTKIDSAEAADRQVARGAGAGRIP